MTALQSNGSPGFVVDHNAFTLRFERRIDADPAHVFEAWTKPEEVTSWWDPDGEPLVACEIDLRVGGSFSFATRQHTERPFAGVYREIAPPGRLVFEAMGATGRVLLRGAAGGGTQMVVEIVCQSADHLEQFVKMGVADGTSRTLDNLVAIAGETAATARQLRAGGHK
jgi:uncharacterized protein YndB with AHSA1/START domain